MEASNWIAPHEQVFGVLWALLGSYVPLWACADDQTVNFKEPWQKASWTVVSNFAVLVYALSVHIVCPPLLFLNKWVQDARTGQIFANFRAKRTD